MNTFSTLWTILANFKERVVADAIQFDDMTLRRKLIFLLFISVVIITYPVMLQLGIGTIVYSGMVFFHLTINFWPEMVPANQPLGPVFIALCLLPPTLFISSPRKQKIMWGLTAALCCATGLIAVVVQLIG